MLSGQQNQLASGQHPAGHEVSSGPHCLFLAIFMSWAFLATKGQSAAVAAQYMLSGQQNQLASGQHPAGHEVSSGPQTPSSLAHNRGGSPLFLKVWWPHLFSQTMIRFQSLDGKIKGPWWGHYA